MDNVTQQNSALVEENAATAKMLEQQAQSMDDQVGYFRLDASESNETAASSARPAIQAPSRQQATAAPRLSTAAA
jgi:hypothetical protein